MPRRLNDFSRYGARLQQLSPDIAGFCAVLRLQSRNSRSTIVTNRTPQQVESRLEEGMGIQLFASEGRTVFVSVDLLEETALEELLEQGLSLLRVHPCREEGMSGDFDKAKRLNAVRFMAGENVLDQYSSAAQLDLLMEAHETLYDLEDEYTRGMGSTLTAVDDEWRIFRMDGTDIHFNVWRTSFGHRVTLSENGLTATVRDSESGHDARMLTDDVWFDRIKRRVRRKMKMGMGVLRGETLRVGHYNIILDAGMAKGLAHEAFGHACESDRVVEGSALTSGGRYLKGDRVAPPGVSIIDFPMAGDWADQPFSANGFIRKTVEIVRDGILTNALTDIFSGPRIGLESTGSERCERYDCVPLPRMSNIRLELDRALRWDREYGLIEADELFDFLVENAVIYPDETWLFLEGYRGGQVNSTTGDYVFNCTAIHKFEAGRVTIHPPAVFSGRVLETLANVRCAVGPLELTVQGMCGKDGQRVPSSGGGHLFTLFNACDGVTIGGR